MACAKLLKLCGVIFFKDLCTKFSLSTDFFSFLFLFFFSFFSFSFYFFENANRHGLVAWQNYLSCASLFKLVDVRTYFYILFKYIFRSESTNLRITNPMLLSLHHGTDTKPKNSYIYLYRSP